MYVSLVPRLSGRGKGIKSLESLRTRLYVCVCVWGGGGWGGRLGTPLENQNLPLYVVPTELIVAHPRSIPTLIFYWSMSLDSAISPLTAKCFAGIMRPVGNYVSNYAGRQANL